MHLGKKNTLVSLDVHEFGFGASYGRGVCGACQKGEGGRRLKSTGEYQELLHAHMVIERRSSIFGFANQHHGLKSGFYQDGGGGGHAFKVWALLLITLNPLQSRRRSSSLSCSEGCTLPEYHCNTLKAKGKLKRLPPKLRETVHQYRAMLIRARMMWLHGLSLQALQEGCFLGCCPGGSTVLCCQGRLTTVLQDLRETAWLLKGWAKCRVAFFTRRQGLCEGFRLRARAMSIFTWQNKDSSLHAALSCEAKSVYQKTSCSIVHRGLCKSSSNHTSNSMNGNLVPDFCLHGATCTQELLKPLHGGKATHFGSSSASSHVSLKLCKFSTCMTQAAAASAKTNK